MNYIDHVPIVNTFRHGSFTPIRRERILLPPFPNIFWMLITKIRLVVTSLLFRLTRKLHLNQGKVYESIRKSDVSISPEVTSGWNLSPALQGTGRSQFPSEVNRETRTNIFPQNRKRWDTWSHNSRKNIFNHLWIRKKGPRPSPITKRMKDVTVKDFSFFQSLLTSLAVLSQLCFCSIYSPTRKLHLNHRKIYKHIPKR